MTSSPSPKPTQNDPDELIRSYLPLAYRLAACYRGSGATYADLVQTASIGLVQAVERFDPESGSAFGPFASPIITGELSRSLRERRGAHRDGELRAQAGQRRRRVARAQCQISAALARGDRVSELARRLSLDADVLADGLLKAAGRETVTLNLPVQRGSAGISGRPHIRPAAA
jgi:RNA polymerase sigma-B factor